MEEVRSAFKILTGKPTGKRPLGRPRRRWEDNIIMDLKEIGIVLLDSLHYAKSSLEFLAEAFRRTWHRKASAKNLSIREGL